MSLTKIMVSKGTFVDRTYYMDEENRLVEKIHHKGADYDAVFAENNHAKQEFRKHDGANMRHVGSIPVDLVLKWLIEEGVDAMCGDEAMDIIINKKLRDPQYKHLLSVPDNYELRRYE